MAVLLSMEVQALQVIKDVRIVLVRGVRLVVLFSSTYISLRPFLYNYIMRESFSRRMRGRK